MWLIVGLGNIGKQYEKTYHNIGFLFVDLLAKSYNFSSWVKKFNSEFCRGRISNNDIILLKPGLFMNNSGKPIMQFMSYYKLRYVAVIYDDIDLETCTVRIKRGGGSGGHNGINSIDEAIGKNYWRIRIGAGRPKYDASSYVLSKIDDLDGFFTTFDCMAQVFPNFFADDKSLFTTRLHQLRSAS